MNLTRWVLPMAALLLGAARLEASPVGVEGAPALDIYWTSGTDPNATAKYVGSANFTVDGDGNFFASDQTFHWGSGAEQDTITLQLAYGNFDPFLNFAVGVIDFGAPSTFSFLFTTPIAPTISGLAGYTLDLAGSFSNGSPNDGGSLAAALPNTLGVLEGQLNGTSIDGTGTGASFPSGGSSTYGPFATAGIYDCGLLGGCTSIGAQLSFLGSGTGDAYSFTGRFEITEVPVPAAVWLFGSTLGLMGVMRRKII